MDGSSVSELEGAAQSVHHFVEVFQGLSIVMIAEELAPMRFAVVSVNPDALFQVQESHLVLPPALRVGQAMNRERTPSTTAVRSELNRQPLTGKLPTNEEELFH